MTKETYITVNIYIYISPVDAMHGGGIAIRDLLGLLLLSLLWLLMLLWLLYPIFHYTSVDCMQRDSTHDRSCGMCMCITLVPYLKRLLDMNLDERSVRYTFLQD